jgi:hypothetical protein
MYLSSFSHLRGRRFADFFFLHLHHELLGLILGIVALSKRFTQPLWAILEAVMIGIGLIDLHGIGAGLVLLGGILGLISRYV